MAILVKRTAKNPIPNFRETGRLGTEGMGGRPFVPFGGGAYGSAPTGGAPVTSVVAPAGATTGTGMPAPTTRPATPTVAPPARPTMPAPVVKPAVPAVTKPTTPITPSVTKPSTITSVVKPSTPLPTPTVKPPTSITSSGTTTPRPTVTTKPGSSSSNALTNSLLTTAAGGVLGNLLQNKTGKSITDTLGLTGKGGLFSGSTTPKQNGPAPVVDRSTTSTPSKNTTGGTKLSEAQTQAELDKASKDALAQNGPPSEAIQNPDGTSYTIDSNGFKTTYDKDGSVLAMEMGTDEELRAYAALTGQTINTVGTTTITAADGTEHTINTGAVYGGDGSVLAPKGSNIVPTNGTQTSENDKTDLGGGYFQLANGDVVDSSGTVVATLGADGTYSLVGGDQSTQTAENTWTDPDTGATWLLGDDGNWTQTGGGNTQLADNTWTDPSSGQVWNLGADGNWTTADNTNYDYTNYDNTNNDTTVASNTDETPPEEAKNGGLITMMKHGGNVRHFDSGGDVSYMPDGAVDNGDGTFSIGNDTFDMMSGNPLYTSNDSGNITYVEPSTNSGYVDNGDGTYTIGGTTYDSVTDMPLYRDNANGGVDLAKDNGDGTYTIGNTTYDMNTNQPVYSIDPRTGATNVAKNAIYSPGSANRSLIPAPQQTPATPSDQTGFLNNIQDILKSGGVQGALLGTLFGQLLSGSGGSSAQNQGVDMSKVGVINPRTTSFGIGAPNVVTADQYANPVDTGNDIYSGTDLYYNLNAPGYNPVNPPEEVAPATEEPAPAESTEPPVAKAAGGLATHYTFGKAVDPAEVMGAPAQGMRMGGLAGAGTVPTVRRFGSLPHPDNPAVGNVNGRHDYRQGAAVRGPGTGQSDDIPAMLADGEYVIDAELVSMLGDGSNKAGAEKLDKFREEVRKHKRTTPLHKIPPPAKSPLAYMKGIK
jgi:hypothetical protein